MPAHSVRSGRRRDGALSPVLAMSRYPAAPPVEAAQPSSSPRPKGRHRPAARHRPRRTSGQRPPGGRAVPRWASVAGLLVGFLMVAVAQAPAVQQGRALANLEKRVVTATEDFAPARAFTQVLAPKPVDRQALLDRASRSAIRDPRGVARLLAEQLYGWTGSQFSCLDRLWTRESGWNYRAQNPSGAYGIPQALPGSKMARSGSDWRTNPVTQIKWGLGYIKSRYGSPCTAWGNSQSHGWY